MKDDDEVKSESQNGETNSASQSDEPADIVDEAEAPRERLVVSISRGLGAVARSVTDGINSVSETLNPLRHRHERAPAEDLGSLLVRLGEMVSNHKQADYASLADSEEFWQLIAKLSAFGRRKRLKRSPDASPRRTMPRRAIRADSREAGELDGQKEQPDKKSGKKSSKKSGKKSDEKPDEKPNEKPDEKPDEKSGEESDE